MKRTFFTFLCFVIILSLKLHSAESSRELGLEGANLHRIASNNDGSIVLALCQGPKGIFFSTDFGESWTFGTGGDYAAGEGQAIQWVSPTKVFVIAGHRLYKADPFTNPLVWSEIEIPDELTTGEPLSLAYDATGGYYFVGMNNGQIFVFDTNENFVSSTNLPVFGNNDFAVARVFSIAVDPLNSFIYAATGIELGKANIYRASYNSVTGAINNWLEKEPTTAKDHYAGVFVAPTGHVYVTTMNATNPNENGVYKSVDFGDNFSLVLPPPPGPSGLATNAHFASFSGTTYLIGAHVSLDSGATWNRMDRQTPTGANLNPNAGVVHPVTPSIALMSSDVGLAKTTDLHNTTTSLWNDKNSGLNGLIVYDMARSSSNPNIVALATKSGLAYTENYLDPEPTWTFPIFANGDSAPHRSVLFDPNDSTRIFVGINRVFEGKIINAGPSINWSEINISGLQTGFMNLRKLVLVNDTTMAACFAQTEGSVGGQLSLIDISGPNAVFEQNFLQNIPVSSFLAIDEDLFIAGIGAQGPLPELSDELNNGIYYSNNGGTSWNHVTLSVDSSIAKIYGMVYDQEKDYLYVYGEKVFTAIPNNETSLQEEGEDPEPFEQGVFLVLSNASDHIKNNDLTSENFKSAKKGLDLSNTPGSMALDPETGVLYTAINQRVYQGFDHGENWTIYHEGLPSETTSMLFFNNAVNSSPLKTNGFLATAQETTQDVLVQGSDANIQELNGDGLPIVTHYKIQDKDKKLSGKKWIKFYFNVAMKKSTKKFEAVHKDTNTEIPVIITFSKSGKSVKVEPQNTWPQGKIIFRIKKNYKTENEQGMLDGKYEGTPGGIYKKTIQSI